MHSWPATRKRILLSEGDAMHRRTRVDACATIAILLFTISAAMQAQDTLPVARRDSSQQRSPSRSTDSAGVTSSANADESVPILRFMAGPSHQRSSDVNDGSIHSRFGASLGLRLHWPRASRWRGEADIRLAVAGLRGPCMQAEAEAEDCKFVPDAQSIGEFSLSLGGSAALGLGMRASALVSPALNLRAVDRVVDGGRANWAGSPWVASLGLDLPFVSQSRMLLEYRWALKADYEPDEFTPATVGPAARQMRGGSASAMLSLPLATGKPGAKGVFNDGDSARAWTSFGLVVENDLIWLDESYTNGLRAFATEVPGLRLLQRYAFLGVQRNAIACPSAGEALSENDLYCRTTQVALTQTMHTPIEIYDRAPQARDRPFAGTLFASLRSDLIRPGLSGRSLITFGSEWQLGVLGPKAFAEHTQSMAHWLIASNADRPAGWPNQLSNRLHAVWMLDATGRHSRMSSVSPSASALRRFFNADLTGRGNAIIGTTHRSGSAGLVGRWGPFGRELPLLTARAIGPAINLMERAGTDTAKSLRNAVSPSRPFRYAVVAALDQRLVDHNETLLKDDISMARQIVEASFGGQVEWGWLMSTFMIVHRGREFAPLGETISGSARYFTAQFTYRPPR